MPGCRARQVATMSRKRAEYQEMVPQWYAVPNSERTEEELAALRQVQVRQGIKPLFLYLTCNY